MSSHNRPVRSATLQRTDFSFFAFDSGMPLTESFGNRYIQHSRFRNRVRITRGRDRGIRNGGRFRLFAIVLRIRTDMQETASYDWILWLAFAALSSGSNTEAWQK